MDGIELLEAINDSGNSYIFAKDLNGKYIYCNERMAAAAGLDSSRQMIGKQDEQLVWHAQAALYRRGDRLVVAGLAFSNVREVQCQVAGLKHVITSKYRLTEKLGKTVGVAGIYCEQKELDSISSVVQKDYKKKGFVLHLAKGAEYLTAKEARVLYFILIGYSVRAAGALVGISENTAAFHYKNIKRKLRCRSKTELVKAGLISGLSHALLLHFGDQA